MGGMPPIELVYRSALDDEVTVEEYTQTEIQLTSYGVVLPQDTYRDDPKIFGIIPWGRIHRVRWVGDLPSI